MLLHGIGKLPCPLSGFHKEHPRARCIPVLSISLALGTCQTKLSGINLTLLSVPHYFVLVSGTSENCSANFGPEPLPLSSWWATPKKEGMSKPSPALSSMALGYIIERECMQLEWGCLPKSEGASDLWNWSWGQLGAAGWPKLGKCTECT